MRKKKITYTELINDIHEAQYLLNTAEKAVNETWDFVEKTQVELPDKTIINTRDIQKIEITHAIDYLGMNAKVTFFNGKVLIADKELLNKILKYYGE